MSSQAFAATINGELFKWHPVEIDFTGPLASEADTSPNPFLDYRLTVELTSPSGKVTRVPGYFAGDGQGHGRGNIWRARFSADEVGQWHYHALIHSGSEIALSLSLDEGLEIELTGSSGDMQIAPAPYDAPEFLRHGRLEYVGEHYLKFRDGPYWIKGGTDSPENLLGFSGIDGTFDQGGIDELFLHDYAEHRGDFVEGDPLFTHSQTGADSRGLIGALNYLGAQGVNSVFFLPMNLGGDGQDTYPFVGASKERFDKTHYDISKLHQWNQVLAHAQRQGIALNIVLSETETANEQWLDDGALGVERKLFFRELVARFGYLLAAKWNLGEENDFPRVELDKHADYLQALDWSGKPIAVHTHINQFYRYGEIVGDSRYGASSIQYDEQFAGQFVEQWRTNSANAGHPWVLDMDENTNGLTPESNADRRKQILYDVLFSGGNIEWYFGYHPQPIGGDIDAGDFRQRESMWQQMRFAREMMQNELPFWEMEPADWRVSGDSDAYGGAEVFALMGEAYAIYLPQSTGAEVLNTGSVSGRFGLRWFDPRTGAMSNGSQQLSASDNLALGSPPYSMGEDWVVLINRLDQAIEQDAVSQSSNEAPVFNALPERTVSVGESVLIKLTATDSDGTFPSVTVGALPAGMKINGPGNGLLELIWTVPGDAAAESVVELIAIDALDSSLRSTQQLIINVRGGEAGLAETGNPLIESSPDATLRDLAPVFETIPLQQLEAGRVLALRVIAKGADGAPPALMLIDGPEGAAFVDNGDGTRTFTWQTRASDTGNRTITFMARDHELANLVSTLQVEVQITP
ncbi:DUF5060 domain-containing protein [Granulosicoccus antarcticus]|uniref:DUF5060 domain-containing protein n=1 Tax=Granulosicoccus antarcticus TaxID=437505 RepID=UPI00146FBEE9|nr:DUF5060 domain-containing protein [Granulosicoccus antarcticus]